jgi:hypothetical protein
MKNFIFITIICSIFISCQSNDSKKPKGNGGEFISVSIEFKNDFRKSVKLFEKLSIDKDYKKLVEYSHPLVIKRLATLNNIDEKTAKAAFVKELPFAEEDFKQKGIIFLKREVTKFSDTFIKFNGAIYTSYQTYTTFTVEKKPASILETTIAISKDNGKWWYFIDKNGNAEGKHILLEEINQELFDIL